MPSVTEWSHAMTPDRQSGQDVTRPGCQIMDSAQGHDW